jgi:hypothetical protein
MGERGVAVDHVTLRSSRSGSAGTRATDALRGVAEALQMGFDFGSPPAACAAHWSGWIQLQSLRKQSFGFQALQMPAGVADAAIRKDDEGELQISGGTHSQADRQCEGAAGSGLRFVLEVIDET